MSSVCRYAFDMTKEELASALAVRGMKQAELARRLTAELGRGIDRAAMNKMVKGTRGIADDEAEAITRILGAAPLSSQKPALADTFSPQPVLGADLVGSNDLPVYAAAMGGEGHLIVTFDPVDYVKRPQPLQHIRDGYAVLITGDSMSPAFRPGDMALVNPRLAPERGQDVILYHTPPDGEVEAMIKTLLAFNERDWTLEQYNPARTFTEARADWPICHRVVGKYARR